MTINYTPAFQLPKHVEGLLEQYYAQLHAMNVQIAARTERPWPNDEELATMRKIMSAVKALNAKPAIVQALDALTRFSTKVSKADPELGDRLLPHLCVLMFPGLDLPEHLIADNEGNTAGAAKKSTAMAASTIARIKSTTDTSELIDTDLLDVMINQPDELLQSLLTFNGSGTADIKQHLDTIVPRLRSGNVNRRSYRSA